MEVLCARWSSIHLATLPLIHTLATTAPLPSPAAALVHVPSGTIDGDALAHALAREETKWGSCTSELRQRLTDFEVILNEMHQVVRKKRATVSALPWDEAADRGSHGLLLAPVDKATIAASSLRCYEAELAFKHNIFDMLGRRCPPPAQHIECLLIAWQCEPLLEPLIALRTGEEEQYELEGKLTTNPNAAADAEERFQHEIFPSPPTEEEEEEQALANVVNQLKTAPPDAAADLKIAISQLWRMRTVPENANEIERLLHVITVEQSDAMAEEEAAGEQIPELASKLVRTLNVNGPSAPPVAEPPLRSVGLHVVSSASRYGDLQCWKAHG